MPLQLNPATEGVECPSCGGYWLWGLTAVISIHEEREREKKREGYNQFRCNLCHGTKWEKEVGVSKEYAFTGIRHWGPSVWYFNCSPRRGSPTPYPYFSVETPWTCNTCSGTWVRTGTLGGQWMSAKTRDLNGVNSYFHKHVCEICDGAHWLNQTGVGEKTQFSGHWTDEPGNIWIFKGTSNVYSRELFGWTHIGENFVEYAPTEIMSEDESDQDPPASGRKGNQPGEGKSNSGEEPKQSNPDSGSKTDTPPVGSTSQQPNQREFPEEELPLVELTLPANYDPEIFFEKRVKGAKWGVHTPTSWSDWEDTDEEDKKIRRNAMGKMSILTCPHCEGRWVRCHAEQLDFDELMYCKLTGGSTYDFWLCEECSGGVWHGIHEEINYLYREIIRTLGSKEISQNQSFFTPGFWLFVGAPNFVSVDKAFEPELPRFIIGEQGSYPLTPSFWKTARLRTECKMDESILWDAPPEDEEKPRKSHLSMSSLPQNSSLNSSFVSPSPSSSSSPSPGSPSGPRQAAPSARDPSPSSAAPVASGSPLCHASLDPVRYVSKTQPAQGVKNDSAALQLGMAPPLHLHSSQHHPKTRSQAPSYGPHPAGKFYSGVHCLLLWLLLWLRSEPLLSRWSDQQHPRWLQLRWPLLSLRRRAGKPRWNNVCWEYQNVPQSSPAACRELPAPKPPLPPQPGGPSTHSLLRLAALLLLQTAPIMSLHC